jgi:hypothetical protein
MTVLLDREKTCSFTASHQKRQQSRFDDGFFAFSID